MHHRPRHTRQLRHPGPNKVSARVLIVTLLDRRINTDGVDPRLPRLHLALRPVDPGLEIHKFTGQHQPRLLPGQPQVVGRKRHQHRPHPEVDPPVGIQIPHGGIDERIAGATLTPRPQILWISGSRPHPGINFRKRLPFDFRFTLQLLHEVTVPMEPRREGADGAGPSRVTCRPLPGQLRGSLLGRLIHLPHRNRPIGEIRRKPRAGALRSDRG